MIKTLKLIYIEIIELKLWEKIILSVLGIILILTGLFELGKFDKFEFNFNNLKDASGFKYFQIIMQLLTGITAFVGIINVYLITKKKITNYFWGIIGIIMYGITAFANAYTGDAILNILFFLPFNIVGLFLWKKHMNKKDEVEVKKTNILELIIWTIFLGILWVGFWFLIPVSDEGLHKALNLKNDDGSSYIYLYTDKIVPHLFDSFTNAASIIASVWMVLRMKEQWILWVVINVIQLIMWCGIGQSLNVGMITMWTIFLLNSIYGTYNWYKRGNFEIQKIANPNLEI